MVEVHTGRRGRLPLPAEVDLLEREEIETSKILVSVPEPRQPTLDAGFPLGRSFAKQEDGATSLEFF